MIAGIFHEGSGLGNQLHRYVATRCLALDKGYEFSMVNPSGFKGKSFMRLDMGSEFPYSHFIEANTGRVIVEREDQKMWQETTKYYNPEFNFIEDDTIIDGEFQDERYFEKHLDKILNWLNINPELMSGFYDDICVIGFRGGEYKIFPELFLTKEYWDEAIAKVRAIKPNVTFKVVTDDPVTAKGFFPDFPISHEIGDDWTSILFAKFLIIANSSFYILPSLLNKNAHTIIAPRYWARRNTGEWSMPQNYYKSFKYI